MIVIAREFAVTGLRLVAASGGRVIAAAKAGKIKTTASIICIAIMLTSLSRFVLFGPITLNWICIFVILVTTVWSGVEYFIKNKDVLKTE
jgi:CDP-diacylglycerol--glycerol-3-phosphate 3-phosphatidyltransferase